MPRIYILKTVYDRLQEQAAVLQREPRELLSAILEERATALDRGNAHLAREMDRAPREEICTVQATEMAWRVVGDLSLVLGLRVHSVATYLVQDALPVLSALPNLPLPSWEGDERMPIRPQVSLRSDLYERVVDRVAARKGEGEDELTLGRYVFALLGSLSSLEIAARLSSEEFVQWATESRDLRLTYRPVGVPRTTYRLFRFLRHRYQYPMSVIFSYLVWEELETIERVDVTPVTTELKMRHWQKLLDDMTHLSADGREWPA